MSRARAKLSDSFRASYATAISPTGEYFAFGRGSKLVLQPAYRLANPSLPEAVPLSVPQIIDAHDDFIHSMAFSPDGNRIATGSTGQVKLWKRMIPSVQSTIALPPNRNLTPIALSNDRSKILSIETISADVNGAHRSVAVLTGADGNVISQWELPEGNWIAGTLFPSNNRVALRAEDNTILVCDITMAPWVVIGKTQSSAGKGVLAWDEQTIFLSSEKKIEVWTIKGDMQLEKVEHPLANSLNATGPIDEITTSRDRSLIAIHDATSDPNNSNIKVWSVGQNKIVSNWNGDRTRKLEATRASRKALRESAWINRLKSSIAEMEKALQSEDNAVVNAVANRDKAEQVFIAKEKEHQTAMQALTDHEKAIADAKAAMEAAAQKMNQLMGETEAKKKVIAEADKQKSTSKSMWDNAIAAVKSAEDSKLSAQQRLEAERVSTQAHEKVLVELQAAESTQKGLSDNYKQKVETISFIGNDFVAAIDTTQSNISIRSVESGESIDSLSIAESTAVPHSSRHLSLNPVSLSGLEPTAFLNRWGLEHTWDSPALVTDRATALAFSADGSQLAIGSGIASRNGSVAFIQLSDYSLGKRIENLHSDSVLGISYSGDGRFIATCGADKQTKILDQKTLDVLATLEGHTHHVMAVAWQEDGQRLATAGADATIKIWDVEKGESTKTIPGLGVEVTAIAFVGTTSNLLSVYTNNLVRLHDVNSGNQIRQFGGASDSLYSVAASANGKFAVASGQEGIARVWWIDDGKLLYEIK